MTALGEALAVMACVDWRAALAVLFDLKRRVMAFRAAPDRRGASDGP